MMHRNSFLLSAVAMVLEGFAREQRTKTELLRGANLERNILMANIEDI